MSARALSPLVADRRGSVAIEYSIVGPLIVGLSLGIAEIGNAFWQWNAAVDAVAIGVRRAAISDPVSADLKAISGVTGTVLPGDPMPYFERICSGVTSTCSNGGRFDRAALRRIVYGGDRTSCGPGDAGLAMCHVLPALRPENVVVEYVQTGLGYAGRPGGPVPTITIRLVGLPLRWVVIGRLFGIDDVQLPAVSTSATGEDLSTTSQGPS